MSETERKAERRKGFMEAVELIEGVGRKVKRPINLRWLGHELRQCEIVRSA